MPIIPLRTKEPLYYSKDSLPAYDSLSSMQDLLDEDELTINSVYGLIEAYSVKNTCSSTPGIKYMRETEYLLQLIYDNTEFDVVENEKCTVCMLALYMQYVISYKLRVKDENFYKNLRDLYEEVFCNIMDENRINESRNNKEIGFNINKRQISDYNSSKNELEDFQDVKKHKKVHQQEIEESKLTLDDIKEKENNLISDKKIHKGKNDLDKNIQKLKKLLAQFKTKTKSLLGLSEYLKYTSKINEIFKSEIASPIFDSLKGIYFLHTNRIENANHLFTKNKNIINDLGKKIYQSMTNENKNITDEYESIINQYYENNLTLTDYKGTVDNGNNSKNTSVSNNNDDNNFNNKNSHNYKGESGSNSSLICNRLNILSSHFESMESQIEDLEIITEIIRIVVLEETRFLQINNELLLGFIADLTLLADFYAVDSFSAAIHFYIGKLYHLQRNYIKAEEYYLLSGLDQALINLSRISRRIIKEDTMYNEINNYIYLANNEYKKIKINQNSKYIDIYKAVKSESFCGKALYSYLSIVGNKDVKEKIVWNNLAYFYYKCVEMNEISIISDFISKYKKNEHRMQENKTKTTFNDKNELKVFVYNIENIKNSLLSDEDKIEDIPNKRNAIIKEGSSFITKNLYRFVEDDTVKYNLSFFTKKEVALLLLNSIKIKSEHVLVRIGTLNSCLDTFQDLINLNKSLAMSLIGNYHLQNRNLRLARDSFSVVITNSENEDIYKHYSFYSLARLSLNEYHKKLTPKILNYAYDKFKEGLTHFPKSYYFALALSAVFYYKKDYKAANKIVKEVLKEIEGNNSVALWKFKNKANLLYGSSLIMENKLAEGLKVLRYNKDKELLSKLGGLIIDKDFKSLLLEN